MDELSPQAKAILEQAKPAFSPSAQQLERLRDRLHSPASPDPSPGAAARTPKSILGLGAIVVAGALAAGVGVIASRQSPSPVHLETSLSSPSPLAPAPALRSWHPGPSTVPPPASRPEPPRATHVTEVSDAPARPRHGPRDQGSGGASLVAELERIIAARRALQRRHYAETQDLARDYLDRFPRGSFREEAEVLDLVARCAEAPSGLLEARAEQYVARSDAGFISRVRNACLDHPARADASSEPRSRVPQHDGDPSDAAQQGNAAPFDRSTARP